MSIYSNNFWKYAKNYGKEATLDEVFVKWANKIDLDIDLGSEIFKEVTAEINKLFGIKEALAPGNPAFGPGNPGSTFDINTNGGATPVNPVANDTANLNPGTPKLNNTTNIPSSSDKSEVELDENGNPKEPDNMLTILKGN